MTEYSRMAKGHFTSTGLSQVINLPFQPDRVEILNYTLANSAATSQNVISAEWDASMGQGFAVIQGYNATPALIYDVVSTNGISSFSAGLSFQFGPVFNNSTNAFTITKATGVVTTTTAHGLATGDVVVFSNLAMTATTGMQQIAGVPFVITRLSATTFSINWNTNQSNFSDFSTAASVGNVGSFKKVLYPEIYFPGVSYISAITTGTTTTIKTTSQHNYVVGQEIAFRIPSLYGTTQLNSLPNVQIPGSPVYGYVISVTDNVTFVASIDSTSFTTFNSNQAFLGTPGRSFPQVIAAGDVNTGGTVISAGSALYPPPQFSYASLNDSSTINGPAIRGAFVNNTSQGFIVGNGAGRVLTTASLVGAASNVIYWKAFLDDLIVN